MPLEPYLVQLRLAILGNDWDQSETAFQLPLALVEEALQVLSDCSLSELPDLEQLTEALRFTWPQKAIKRR